MIDTIARTVIATYPLAFSVTALAVSPDGKRVYAGRTGDGYADVAVIDITAERVGTIDIATGAGMSVDARCRSTPQAGISTPQPLTFVAARLVVVDLETTAVERDDSAGFPHP